MLMIPARLGRSESFWAVVKVRSPHTGPEVSYPRNALGTVYSSLCTWAPGRVDRVPLMMYSVAKYCNSSHTSHQSLDAKEIHSENDF